MYASILLIIEIVKYVFVPTIKDFKF